MSGVSLEGIVKADGAVQVVHGVDIKVQKKEFVVLVGPSGCGKSTTLRTQMRAEIKRLHKRLGVTSIYVTHDQVEAMTLADRNVVMNDGRNEQIGTPMDLFLTPANTFVAAFLGAPPMNLLDATMTGDATAEFSGQSIPLPALGALKGSSGLQDVLGVMNSACARQYN